ncbi:hypothetical protein [Paraburkholderia aromaticivorans]|uniref:Uncharacterized protein n=1 Tax=Paraburkholderia aromaticivorans TaxID=2026199 RepID=A0A248VX92_9BURK|nr:hypothetical protein [Paraburkholderia aromaticivorans]ASW03644.1 hypothetical protein CJU94_36175 [Paraburkholderia aromaticivorans]
MGSTVITNKKAGAFRADGRVVYVLFEQLYEKNCYPHTPEWQVSAFGEREDVLKRIFRAAESCESGMLQSRAGSIKPEAYIEHFKQHLSKPFEIPESTIRLSVGESYSSPIPRSGVDAIRPLMEAQGFAAQFDQIEAGSLSVSLHKHVDLLLALYGEKGRVLAPWRVFSHLRCSDTVLAVSPVRNVKADDLPNVRAFKLDAENVAVSFDGSPIHPEGWTYRAVGDFMNVAYERELQSPGWGKHAIPWYRDLLHNAPQMPDNAVVTVRRDGADSEENESRRKAMDRVALAAGVADADGKAPAVFSFPFGKLCDDRQRMWDFTHLPKEQVVFELKQQATTNPGQEEADADDCPNLQLAFELI